MTEPSVILYVLGTEGSGKTDLVRQLTYLCDGVVRTHPAKSTPTMGQDITVWHVDQEGGAKRGVEVRELGGCVVSSWESFISSRVEKDAAGAVPVYALLFVVDAAAVHQLCLAIAMLKALTCEGGVCSEWGTLIVLQKSAVAHALTSGEVWELIAPCSPLASKVSVLVADSWNGFGLGDVLDWVRNNTRTGVL